jgi:hypothetical protein
MENTNRYNCIELTDHNALISFYNNELCTKYTHLDKLIDKYSKLPLERLKYLHSKVSKTTFEKHYMVQQPTRFSYSENLRPISMVDCFLSALSEFYWCLDHIDLKLGIIDDSRMIFYGHITNEKVFYMYSCIRQEYVNNKQNRF